MVLIKEIEIITEHYGNNITKGDVTSQALINSTACMDEWDFVKRIVLNLILGTA